MLPSLKRTLIAVSVFASFSSISQKVIANNVIENIERISIIATRKESLNTDLAMSVHSINSDELKIDNGQHIAESLNSVSGVLIDQLSGGQGHKTAIRMPLNTSGYYLFLQDNVPIQSAAFFNHNALWWSSFNSNASRVEVLKGAGTALYGSGAVAATINVLSKPISKNPETNLSMTLGESEYNKIALSHSQKIDDKNGLGVSASYLSNQGWRDHTGSERSELTARHELKLSHAQTLTTSLVMSDLEQEMAAGLSKELFETDPTNSGLPQQILQSDPLRKSQYLKLSTQWDFYVDEDYYSAIGYIRHRTNDYTATWSANMPNNQSQVNSLGLLALANWQHHNDANSILGIDIELTEGEQFSDQPTNITTTGYGADIFVKGEVYYDDTTRYTSIAPYFQHQRSLAENLEFTVGARLDYTKFDFDNHMSVIGDIGHGLQSLADRNDSFKHLSPKTSLNYHLTDNSSTYLRYANSFRLPTAGSLYHIKSSDTADNITSIDAEVSDTFELGYKSNLEKISIDLALFYMDVDDAIVRAYDDNGQRFLTNAGRVIHKGFEASINWQVANNFDVSVAYSKAEHEYDEFIIDAGRIKRGELVEKDLSGKTMVMAPEYLTNLRLRYQPEAIAGLSTMLEVQSIGEYWMDEANEQSYDGYTIANIKLYFDVTNKLSLNARILNLTDKFYVQEAQVRYGKEIYQPAAPRTAYLGLNYQW
ncbi:TonB-dependent receptor [Pseudoalteromonas sp. NBT06-2]|uniref:TonB-dependent receptor n=1 Tax=Pseudoalteromonas sp. NBT06-2 TaxID=2025950 RepID=UPI000BA7C176|nr:TonB-dependent receptor [Pseudoalteromonas sp. NBT06-2]PAJ74063.1 TonB-dependent receptor [Pseudoalteromonas sp. NBT06-2]